MSEVFNSIPTWLSSAMIVSGAFLLLFSGWRGLRRSKRAKTERAQWDELLAQRERYERDPEPRTTPARDKRATTATPAPRSTFTPAELDRLDSKIATLQRLIHEADTRIARLGNQTPAKPRNDSWPPAAAEPIDPELDELTQRVYDLADQGHDPATIAAMTSTHRGQVELMLAIRRDS